MNHLSNGSFGLANGGFDIAGVIEVSIW